MVSKLCKYWARYVYIYIEKEREKELDAYIYVCVYAYVYAAQASVYWYLSDDTSVAFAGGAADKNAMKGTDEILEWV